MINGKIDFMLTIEVEGANPNGDPLAGNLPRTDSEGFGLISDVAIKRKIRNRLQDDGYAIFVQANDRIQDDFTSLQKRYENKFVRKDSVEKVTTEANKEWIDIRAFGQVFTYHEKSLGIRGAVSISMAKSIAPVVTTSMQIVRSTNGQHNENKRSPDTMGTKHYVEYGVYLVKGSVNAFFAEKNGFNDDDVAALKKALLSLFENDASAARPEGSMRVRELFWFEHPNKLGAVSSARIYNLLEWNTDGAAHSYEDYQVKLNSERLAEYKEKGLKVEIKEGY